MGCRTLGDLGETIGGKRQGLARQPFQIAVLAHMDHGVGAEFAAQPGIERQIAVRRHQVRVVVGAHGIDVVTPRRLQAQGDVAEAHHRKPEMPVGEERIVLGPAPLLNNPRPRGLGHRGKKGLVVFQGEPFATDPRRARREVVGRPHGQAAHHGVAVGRQFAKGVTGLGHRAQKGERAGRRIKADAVADASVPVRVVGQDQGDAPVLG